MLLQQLVTFARVVELGSFTRAGELLNLSQPAVTRQVAALEQEMGAPLVERGGRRIAVTAVGLFTLPVLLNDFRRRYPLVRFQVWSGRTDGVLDRLLDGNADLALLSAPIAHPRLQVIPLFEDPIVLVA